MAPERVIAALMVAALALAACREEEQDRALQFEKGVYLGSPMSELDEDTRADLLTRLDQQNF